MLSQCNLSKAFGLMSDKILLKLKKYGLKGVGLDCIAI